MKRVLMIVAAVVVVPCAFAQSEGMKGMEMKDMPMKIGNAKIGETHKGKGTVKSIDAAKGTLILAHDPIQSMNWPAMTMTFKAKDKAMLDNVKPGSKVDFSFIQSGKDYIVVEMK